MSKKQNKFKGQQGSDYEPTGVLGYLGLGRPIDFSNGPTKIAFICSFAAIVGMLVLKGIQGIGSDAAFMGALGAGICFFFSFTLGLELDPDRSYGGIIGGFLSLIAAYFFGEGDMFVMLWLIFLLRMLNRTAGDRHRALDNIIIIGCAAWMGKCGFWLYPILTGIAYAIESQIEFGYFRSMYLAGIAFASVIIADRTPLGNALNIEYIYIMGLAFILFLPVMRMGALTKAKGDKNGKPISSKRLQAEQAYFMVVCVAVALFHGNTQAVAIMPAVMAAMGCGIYLVIDLMNKKKSGARR